jgi:hypothetical protein
MALLRVIQPAPPASGRGSQPRPLLKSIALRLYRLGILVCIVWMIRAQQAHNPFESERAIKVEEVRSFFPTARRLDPDTSERMGLWVLDTSGNRVGYVLRTSPVSDKIIGYCGPTDTLVALTPDKQNPKVIGIKVRSTLDTLQHVQDVEADESFMGTWNGKKWDEVAGMDPRAAGIEGVSGASLSSMSIANGIRRRFESSNQAAKASAAAAKSPIHIGINDIGACLVVLVALLFTFTRLRSQVWLRRAFQLVLIGYLGFFSGQLLAQSLFAGWAASGIPWRAAPGLALIAATALLVPWGSRRQLYCSHVCPHGAAQELIGRASHKRFGRHLMLPRGIDRGLRWLPPMLIVLVLIVSMLGLPVNLAGIEPFDAYLIRAAGIATIVVAIVGLIAAAFVPMAYCKYGCPTGLLLSFVRSHGKADSFGRRDFVAGLLALGVFALYFWHQPIHHWLIGS